MADKSAGQVAGQALLRRGGYQSPQKRYARQAQGRPFFAGAATQERDGGAAKSSKGESVTLGLGNRVFELFGGLDPKRNGDSRVCES